MQVKAARNAGCPCGSGKKYKKCCGFTNSQPTHQAPPADLQELAALAEARMYRDLEVKSRDVLARFPASGAVMKVLALALWEQDKDALPVLRDVTALLPDDAEAHTNLGNALRAASKLNEAVSSHRRALEINPQYAEAHNNLGSALLDLGLLAAAGASFRRAVALRPNFALAHCNLANVLTLQNEIDAAEASCRRALEVNPTLTRAIVNLAEIEAGRGRFAAAEDLLKAAISFEPDMPEAWAGLVRWRRMSAGDTAWLAKAQRIVAGPLVPRREIHLRYALGKYFDDLAEYEQAFSNYCRANELAKLGGTGYDRQQVSRAVDWTVEFQDRHWLQRLGESVNRDEHAVFIIGMPRSGTTLVEQILAAHPEVFGAGELPFWSAAGSRHAASRCIGEDERCALERLAGEYMAVLHRMAPEARRVVDKMPANVLHLGLIHAALPKSRIIHVRRNPLDTCLSIFFQNFGAGHAYANDLDDLVHYYTQYIRLRQHWRETISSEVLLEVPYEALVADPEPWSRQMLEFIGLEWNPKCLEFHLSTRPVNTLSKWQARQRISTASVARWRHYERFLGPIRALADAEHSMEPT